MKLNHTILSYQNRINLLSHRSTDNQNIIRKLKRKIRQLQNES